MKALEAYFFGGFLLILILIIIILAVVLVQERNEHRLTLRNRPFRSHIPVFPMKTNRMFNQSEDVDFVCISMPHRKESHFRVLENKLEKEQILLTYFEGINGKKVKWNEYDMTPRYRKFFENNLKEFQAGNTKTDYRGHFGCTLSHLNVMDHMKHMTVILEDDVDPVPNFRMKFQHALASVFEHDPFWDVLLLGWCCNYNDHHHCKINDREPIITGGLVKVHFWIGGWAYCIRSPEVGQRILRDFFDPLDWHVDLSLAEAARKGKLKVYGCMPTIMNHGGSLRISSFDFYSVGDPTLIKSDTNNEIPDHV